MLPTAHTVQANGLDHHVLEWARPGASGSGGPSGGRPAFGGSLVTAVLVHGFMDAAASWDLVAPRLAEAGLRVLAPDMRGFGDGPRLAPGGYYYFSDYVFDLAELLDALVAPGAPMLLVGHSMGGTVVTLYAGLFPERLAGLVVAEGAGPPEDAYAGVPVRMRKWIDDVRSVRARGERSMASREEALRRLSVNHPRVELDVLRSRFDALVRDLPDGRVAWKADPLHATRSPIPFFAGTFKAFAARVTCPVLFVSGGPLGWHVPDEDERVASFPDVRRVEIEGAGHMMHWTRPDELANALLAFAPGRV
jgi:pimeloyl-ACP methyl ester carboxylesterase